MLRCVWVIIYPPVGATSQYFHINVVFFLFNSLSVLFIWFIYNSIFMQIGFEYTIYLKNIHHIQSHYGSHTVPQCRSDERLFAVTVQVSRVTISGLCWVCLSRWYGFSLFSFHVLLWWRQWMKRDTIHIHVYKFIV